MDNIMETNLPEQNATSENEEELITDNIEFSIDQWSRNRAVSNYEILQEGKTNSKRMLFG